MRILGDESYVDIVFDAPLSRVGGRFVEVEDPFGNSVCVGEWVKRDGGYWALRIPYLVQPPEKCRHYRIRGASNTQPETPAVTDRWSACVDCGQVVDDRRATS